MENASPETDFDEQLANLPREKDMNSQEEEENKEKIK